jgi:glutaminase
MDQGAGMHDWQTALDELYLKYRDLNEGKVANYIPELAKADPSLFGIAVVTVDGQCFTAGDWQQTFTIQSVSKPFIYGMALEDFGRETVLRKVGVEPTGERFNAIIELDHHSKRPLNPMVNAGAMATSSLIKGSTPSDRFNRLLEAFARYTGRPMSADMAVFLSERTTGHRNRAIAHLLLNFGMLDPNVEETLDLYFQQCSIEVNTRDLATMAGTLANQGLNPVTGQRALSEDYIQDLLSVMLTCGLYDFAGEWAYRVGLPAKSGVGGGMVAVSPGCAGIGVFSPLLDERGTPLRAIKVCEELSRRFGLHVFAPSQVQVTRQHETAELMPEETVEGVEPDSRCR